MLPLSINIRLGYFRFILIFVMLSGILFGTASAQHTLAFERFTPRDGLSSYSVFSSLQDRYGFLWFGTSNGLAKFDGYTFRIFSHDPADTTTLSDNRIRALFEDSDGNLWIGTPAGLNIMRDRGELFERITANEMTPDNYRLPENDVRSIAQSSSGDIWISTKGGGVSLLKMPKDGKSTTSKISIQHFQHISGDDKSLIDNSTEGLAIDNNGMLWAATDKGVSRLDTSKPVEGFTNFDRFVAGKRIIENPDVETICQTPDGKIWAGTTVGLALFNTESQAFELYQPFPGVGGNMNLIWCVASAEDGSLYVGGVNGLG
ncbi:MAG: two-component regulator propeller domain-containing protein, partial [Calditrichota bacterium]